MAKCIAELKVAKERHGATGSCIERMRQHLIGEKAKGLTNIRFCGVPAEGATELTAEKLASVYCKVFGC